MVEHRAQYVLFYFWVNKDPIMIGPYTTTTISATTISGASSVWINFFFPKYTYSLRLSRGKIW